MATSRGSQQEGTPDWTYGVFGCFGNPVLCVATFVVPCVTFGLTVDDFSEKNCCLYGWLWLVPGLGCYLQTEQRVEIRGRRAIPGSFKHDLCWVCWCTLCTLVQQTREVVEMKGEEQELEDQLSKSQGRPERPPPPSQSNRYVTEPVRTQPQSSRAGPYTVDITPPTQGTDEYIRHQGVEHDYDEPTEPSSSGYVNVALTVPPSGGTDSYYHDMNSPDVYVEGNGVRPDVHVSGNRSRQGDSDYYNQAYDYEPVNVQDVGYI